MSRVKSNPLSTRFVQPGRIDWQADRPEHTLDAIAEYFTCKLNWRAAIVGPHGSGKSTLLEHLVPLVGQVILKQAAYEPDGLSAELDSAVPADAARRIVWLKLRGRSSSRRLLKETRPQWCQAGRLLVIDGFEQLSLLSRTMVVLVTARYSVGLLLTSHQRTRLPTLIETRVDARMAARLLDQTLPAGMRDRQEFLDQDRLDALLKAHRGSMREVFMQLYDEIENRGADVTQAIRSYGSDS